MSEMKVEQYQVKNNMSMDPMHDSYADEIIIENNYLIIVYDKLDEGVLGPDGLPEYKNKKLTIKYELDTHCDAQIFYNDNKYLWIDMLDNKQLSIILLNFCILSNISIHKYLLSL